MSGPNNCLASCCTSAQPGLPMVWRVTTHLCCTVCFWLSTLPQSNQTVPQPTLCCSPTNPSSLPPSPLPPSRAPSRSGQFVDASPFQSSDRGEPVDHTQFGKLLEEAGFTRNGGEVMISGVTGEPFPVDIYIGVVYYQRLRHMVSDKFQVGGQYTGIS